MIPQNKKEVNHMNKDNHVKPEEAKEAKKQELDLDDLNNVTGGSLRNVHKTETVDISEDTRNKI